MSCKLYANDVCVLEVNENPDKVSQHDLYNCPNCGAPLKHNYCEYCGTVFKRSDGLSKTLDKLCEMELERKNRELDEYRQRIRNVNRDYQMQTLLNQLNAYSIDTQIMNVRGSINTGMASQMCNIQQSMLNANASTQANIFTCNHNICQEMHERDVTAMTAKAEELSSGREYSKLILILVVFIFIILEVFFLIQFFGSL